MDFDDMYGGFISRSGPMKKRNLSWLNPLISGASGVLGTILQNVFNTQQLRETNKANRELVELQNQAAAQESEKAYQRSLPINQVNAMQVAGMSKAGAINALNGGGSYQPAPVNTAQDQTPQLDLSSAINAMQASAQLAEQKRQFNAQLSFERDKFDKEYKIREAEHKIDTQLKREQITDIISAYTGKEFDNAIKNIEYRVAKALEQDNIDSLKAVARSEEVNALLDAFRSSRVLENMHSMSDEDIRRLFELQATLNMLQQGLQYDGTQFIVESGKKLLKLFSAAKGSGKYIRTH